MRQLTRKLLAFTLLTITATALCWPTPASTTATDCDLVVQLCREGNARLYELCVVITGDYTGCAMTEAQNNIKCIADNGCGPVPKSPGDN